MKNFLIISSVSDTLSLLNFFTELKNKGHCIYWLSNKKSLIAEIRRRGWAGRLTPLLLPPNDMLAGLAATVIMPLIYIVTLARLSIIKTTKKPKAVICFGWGEKIIFTPIAKLLHLKIIWFECPRRSLFFSNPASRVFYKLFAHWAQIIVFNNLDRQKLERCGLPRANIARLNYGLKAGYYARQENIFSELAQVKYGNAKHKFFTVGAIVDLDGRQNLETLFRAVKKCLDIIPEMQVVIAGDGREKRSLSWLAKKIGIDGPVWFVGRQIYLKKWLNNFDIYVVANHWLALKDIDVILQALSARLPVIGPAGIGLEDLIAPGKNGLLINGNDSEELAQAIIKLRQNPKLRQQFGRTGEEMVDKNFTIDKMIKIFEGMLTK